MLNEIRLINFQPHAKRRFVFRMGLNVLVGPNDAGKSSVLRGIRWACFNRPSGNTVVKHGENKTSASVVFPEGILIRSREGSKNAYKIKTDTTKKFVAFGQGVPEEVIDFTKMQDVNFQRQIDPPFWMSLHPSDLARDMHRILALEVIDRSVAFSLARVRQSKQDSEELEAEYKEVELAIGSYRWVTTAQDYLDQINKLEPQVLQDATEVKSLKDQVISLSRLTNRASTLNEAAESANAVITCACYVVALQDEIELLTEIIDLIKKCDSLMDLWVTTVDLDTMNALADIVTRTEEQIETLTDLIQEIRTGHKQWTKLKALSTELTKRIEEIPTCETCGQPVQNES